LLEKTQERTLNDSHLLCVKLEFCLGKAYFVLI